MNIFTVLAFIAVGAVSYAIGYINGSETESDWNLELNKKMKEIRERESR